MRRLPFPLTKRLQTLFIPQLLFRTLQELKISWHLCILSNLFVIADMLRDAWRKSNFRLRGVKTRRLVCSILCFAYSSPCFGSALCEAVKSCFLWYSISSCLVTMFLCSTDCETGPDAKGQLSKMCRPGLLCVSNIYWYPQAGLESMKILKHLQELGVFWLNGEKEYGIFSNHFFFFL